jgi:PAS domain S-box-containing protein
LPFAKPTPDMRRPTLALRAFRLMAYCQHRSQTWRIGLAIVIVLSAILLRVGFLGMLQGRLAYLTLYPAVSIAAMLGGLPAGFIATALAALLVHLLIVPLHDVGDIVGLAAFLVSCTIIVGMAEAMRVFQARLIVTEQSQRKESQLSVFIERVPAAIAMFDRDMKYLAASARWKADFGLAGVIIGRSHYELFPEITESWRQIHRRGMAGEISCADEELFVRQDGSQQWLRWDVQPWLGSDDEVGGILIFCEDLTEGKAMKERIAEARKLEIVGRLSGGIAHDFNNLLTVIVGNADFLAEQLGSRADLQQLAGDICAAGGRCAELTRQMLSFGRRQLLCPAALDANALLGTLHREVAPTLPDDVEFNTVLEPELPPAFADPSQLQDALTNLVMNAKEAMPRGGRITMATAVAAQEQRHDQVPPQVPDGDYVVIVVNDNGSGMPPEVIRRAFEPFFTTKEVGRGSGLGLSMVYGFAKQSNGHVTIDSEPDRGTTVRLYLPMAETDRSGWSNQDGWSEAAESGGAVQPARLAMASAAATLSPTSSA